MTDLKFYHRYIIGFNSANQHSYKEVDSGIKQVDNNPSILENPVDKSGILAALACFLFYALFVMIFETITHRKGFRRNVTKIGIKRSPCETCNFFADNPYLRCAVHPDTALTPLAFTCQDYRPEHLTRRKRKR